MPGRAVVRHAWIFVHLAPDSMPAKVADRGITALLDILLNGMTDIAYAISLARHLKGGEKALLEGTGVVTPKWLTFDAQNLTGTVAAMPAREDIDCPIEEHLIVELYSR